MNIEKYKKALVSMIENQPDDAWIEPDSKKMLIDSYTYISDFILKYSDFFVLKTFLENDLRANLVMKTVCEKNSIYSLPDKKIFIVGQFRSGTTLIQRILTSDNRMAYVSLLNMSYPIDQKSLIHKYLLQPIKAIQIKILFEIFLKNLMLFHPMKLRLPEECMAVMGHAGLALPFVTFLPLFDYIQKMPSADFETAFSFHRKFMTGSLSQSNIQHEGVVFKCPSYCLFLPALLKVYSDAILLHLHRDPCELAVSCCNMFFSSRKVFFGRANDLAKIRSEVLKFLEAGLLNWHEYSKRSYPEAKFIDLSFKEMQRDPYSFMRNVYSQLDIDFKYSPDEFKKILAQLNKKHKIGQYKMEDFGLNEGEIRERFSWYYDAYSDFL